ncbi:DUF5994 family protein [Microlunatus sp. GCM10028923]|uniref:DUF5994 family protein n=1 Tax=Microlunatus sp. GCM10028923 TaxID=3273400 RepID=UPI0036199B72
MSTTGRHWLDGQVQVVRDRPSSSGGTPMTNDRDRNLVTTAVAEPSTPRLRLRNTTSPSSALDGGWWPRSTNPVAELPGLILALDKIHGPVQRMVLHRADWTHRPRRLGLDGRVIRLAYFDSHPSGLVTAFSSTFLSGRTDLLVVPATTRRDIATAAMNAAADQGNRLRARQILTYLTDTIEQSGVPGAEGDWENEGGSRPTPLPQMISSTG